MTAIGCGHVGLDDLAQEDDDSTALDNTTSGGKSGDGDLGGATNGSGGTVLGLGGAGAGGDLSGTGGTEAGSGGTDSSTGGVWEPDDESWTDPNRTGCWPFCPVVNSSFSTHYLFEQAVVPAPGVESNGELYVATDRANWGVSSLGVSFFEAPSHAYIPVTIDTSLAGSIYVRTWIYVPSGAITGDVGLLEFLNGETKVASVTTHPEARLSVETPLTRARAMSRVDTYPMNEWFCLRAAVHLSEFTGSVTAEASDIVVAEIVGADTRALTDDSSVHFGVTRTGAHQGPGQIYWDSIVIDQEPVACDDMSVPL